MKTQKYATFEYYLIIREKNSQYIHTRVSSKSGLIVNSFLIVKKKIEVFFFFTYLKRGCVFLFFRALGNTQKKIVYTLYMKNNSVERKVREIENTTGDSKGEIIKK